MTETRRNITGLPRVSTASGTAAGGRAVTGDLSALRAKNRVVAPAEPAPAEPPTAPAEKKPSNKAVTVYISQDVFTQARLAFNATRSVEGDRNWSQFVEKAVAGEVERRAQRHNGGDPFEGLDAPLSPGRPLADN